MAGTKGRSGGKRSGAGRKPGVPNKVSADLKAALNDSFGKVGGVKYLVELAKNDPRTYCTLLGKLVPTTVAGDPENPLVFGKIEVEIVDPKS